MSTISGTINNGITLASTSGPDTYASPLGITSTGYVNAGTNGASYGPTVQAAVVAEAAAPLYLLNQGRIRAAGTVIGVLDGSTNGFSVNNTGTITAAAGAGVLLNAGDTLTSSGTIISTGKAGVSFSGAANITNSGTALISGYTAGIEAARGYVNNSGTITA